MGGMNQWEEVLATHTKVVLDTMVLIYLIERHPRYFDLAKKVLETIESGALTGIISTITLAEILISPAQAGDMAAMRDYELYLLNFPCRIHSFLQQPPLLLPMPSLPMINVGAIRV